MEPEPLETADLELRSKLMRLARRLGHGPEEAGDLAQDCLLALASGSFRGDSSLRTWLYRVLWNRHVERLLGVQAGDKILLYKLR